MITEERSVPSNFDVIKSGGTIKDICSVLSDMFMCEIFAVGTNDVVRKLNSPGSTKEASLYFGMQNDEDNIKFYEVSFPRETLNLFQTVPNVSEHRLKYDNVGRLHLDTPYSGHSHLRLRSHKYNSTSIATHVTDLFEILKDVQKSVFFFLTDGGPDFNPSHMANALFYYRLFKKLDADMLAVMTYAARCSAFNCIEHLWSPRSNDLSGVVFSPLADGDTRPPCQQSLANNDLMEKEKLVFDRAMKQIENQHWKDASFDGFPVEVKSILVGEDKLLFSDYSRVMSFLQSPLREIHNFPEVNAEFKAMLSHMDRHLNEIVFVKCKDKRCRKPYHATEVPEFMTKNIGRLNAPSVSSSHEGRFRTFLQECVAEQKRFGDAGQPLAQKNDLGACPHCPHFAFKSKTEKTRHMGMFHRRKILNLNADKNASFTCNFKDCGKTFSSQPTLSRHQTALNHRNRDIQQKEKPKKAKKRKNFTIADAMRQVSSKRRHDADNETDEPCASDDCAIEQGRNRKIRWVQCDYCDSWYHTCCVGVDDKTDADLDDFCFVCSICNASVADMEKRKK